MAHSDLERLLNEVLSLAKTLLKKNKEFYPFGFRMTSDNAVQSVATFDGDERPSSEDVISILRSVFREDAQSGNTRATAVCYDCRVAIPSTGKKSDAIAVALDHENGESVIAFVPYQKAWLGGFKFEPLFASQGSNLIWRKP